MSNETNQGAVIGIHNIIDDMGKWRRSSCSLFLVISKKKKKAESNEIERLYVQNNQQEAFFSHCFYLDHVSPCPKMW